jgi:alpha-tubulin suppressor-like RCC1 family protein
MKTGLILGAGALLLTVLGCRSDTPSPTEPQPPTAEATTAAGDLAFYQVSAGSNRSCGVTMDNRLYCWGDGPLGDGTFSPHRTPLAIGGALRFQSVSAGNYFSCAVTTDYHAYCWGRNFYGNVGDGTLNDRLTPVRVAGGLRFRSIGTGAFHTCGVSYSDGRAYCWGQNTSGQLGDGTTINRSAPAAVAGGRQFRYVEGGDSHTCGLSQDSRAFCWGSDNVGQLGDGAERLRHLRPVLVIGGYHYRQLDTGDDHACGVTLSYRAICWGYGGAGQIGDGKTLNRFEPRAVAGGLTLSRVTAGGRATCAEDPNDRIYCWGWNLNGELGDGTETMRLTPVRIYGGLALAQVSTGRSFNTCGRTAAGVAYCWGFNGYGQLGDGSNLDSSIPVRVVGPM